ncbi:hypothetical protein DRW03_15000 [Corallococcus sp. H22C18031201]|uniref:hypothetical protein n=1 Tax=Citreicoccus inhibens TaxID=2849499 RepID=UPI000E73EB13|nr:hypothetical protein [Citreicoccus inhibens]MBU8895347.1 hypothetical protein [Citreicoccus inhibens]RJS22608.1 hypothetical protein DRW03_15000 [Corallococcus sp. H22C18031201]
MCPLLMLFAGCCFLFAQAGVLAYLHHGRLALVSLVSGLWVGGVLVGREMIFHAAAVDFQLTRELQALINQDGRGGAEATRAAARQLRGELERRLREERVSLFRRRRMVRFLARLRELEEGDGARPR